MHAFVVACGAGQTEDALVLAERLGHAGFDAAVVKGPDVEDVGREALGLAGRYVDPRWVAADGRTATAEEVARALGHEAAWRQASELDGPSLVLDATAVVDASVAEGVAHAVAGADDWAVLHLCHEGVRGAGYVLTPGAATELLDTAPPGIVPVAARLGSAALDGYEILPFLVEAPDVPPGRVLTDHLVVVSVPPAEVVGRAEALAAELDTGCVVLVLPAGRSRLLGSPAEVLAEVARLGAPSLLLPGPVVLTVAGEGATPAEVSDAGDLVAALGADPTRLLALGGRVLDVVTEREPLVVAGDDTAALARLEAELDDPGSRDLVRLLRYRDACAPPAELVVVAADIVQVPFWTEAFCATVVRAAEAVGAFVPDDDDPVPGHEISLAAISPRLFAHLEDDLAVRLLPQLHRVWPYVDYHGLRDAFVIKYAPGQQEELRIHHDVAQLSASVKLNAGYEGAELEFPRQGWTNAGVPVGHLVAWPSLVTHPHQTAPLRRGVKYGLTIWFEVPGS